MGGGGGLYLPVGGVCEKTTNGTVNKLTAEVVAEVVACH